MNVAVFPIKDSAFPSENMLYYRDHHVQISLINHPLHMGTAYAERFKGLFCVWSQPTDCQASYGSRAESECPSDMLFNEMGWINVRQRDPQPLRAFL